MQFETVIQRRRMIRAYTAQPVDPESIERIVASGIAAPSAGNAQGTRLAVVLDEDRRSRIAEAAGEAAWVAKGYSPWLGAAPVLIGLGTRIGDYVDRYNAEDKAAAMAATDWSVPYWWFDAGAACEAILLAAVNEGLAAGLLGAHNIPGLTRLLEWSDIEPVGVITIGHEAATSLVGSALTQPRRPDRVTWHRE